MKTYAIHEGNMERLTKKIVRIQNKCQKYGCEFHFAEVGEEFREITDEESGDKYTVRYVIVEAEGVAAINGWKFIASLEHTENGNIINKACDIEVPERYYNTTPVCEHCNSNRPRKQTFIVMNEETGEFKQVGKSCLADFTHGLSASGVAQYIAAFDEIIAGEAPAEGMWHKRYVETNEFLRYVAETIRLFGYVKTGCSLMARSTAERASSYYAVGHGWINSFFGRQIEEEYKAEMKRSGFDAESTAAYEETDKALKWLEEQPETNNYIHNLKVVCANNYIEAKDMGILASLFPTYNRELERECMRKKEAEQGKKSGHVGKVGERIIISVESVKLITSWETDFGTTYVWKITGKDGNVYTWKTGNIIKEGCKTIKGTVKGHNEYREVKQTELTRCKCSA